MQSAQYVTEVSVVDPDTQAPVELAIYKCAESGAMFGVDSCFILALSDDDPVNSPFTGHDIQLIGD